MLDSLFDDYILLSKTSTSKSAPISAESLFVVVLVAQLVSRHSCVADRLPVVVRFPAGPRVRLKTVDPPKGNGLGQKKICWKFVWTSWSRFCQRGQKSCWVGLEGFSVGSYTESWFSWRWFCRNDSGAHRNASVGIEQILRSHRDLEIHVFEGGAR